MPEGNDGDPFDFNSDGITDPGEEYLAFRIWEEINGIREEGETADGVPEQEERK